MASTSKDVPSSAKQETVPDDLEPGACTESILNPTDTFEEFASDISSSLEDRNTITAKSSTISEIQSEIGESSKETLRETKSSDNLQSKDVSFFINFFALPMILTRPTTNDLV